MNYKIGDVVEIIGQIGGHNFKIGEIVEIKEVRNFDYRAHSTKDYWYVGDDELKIYKENGRTTEESFQFYI